MKTLPKYSCLVGTYSVTEREMNLFKASNFIHFPFRRFTCSPGLAAIPLVLQVLRLVLEEKYFLIILTTL